jgi:hypothetical protein
MSGVSGLTKYELHEGETRSLPTRLAELFIMCDFVEDLHNAPVTECLKPTVTEKYVKTASDRLTFKPMYHPSLPSGYAINATDRYLLTVYCEKTRISASFNRPEVNLSPYVSGSIDRHEFNSQLQIAVREIERLKRISGANDKQWTPPKLKPETQGIFDRLTERLRKMERQWSQE